MAFFPAAVATTANLYTAVNSLQTTLATALGTGDTSVVLTSSTGFPTAGAATIDNEVIFYTGISGATLTGCTRGADGTTAATHSVGVPVGAAIVAFHHNGLMTEVIAVETYLNTKFGTSGSAYGTAKALQTNASTGIPEVSSVTNTELGYLSGVTSAIQTQFTGKVGTTGNETIAGVKTFSSIPVFSAGISVSVNIAGIDLILGSSGTAGSWQVFPSTASKGKTLFQVDNNSGDTTTTLKTAAQAGARTYDVPDAGASAHFVMTEGTKTINGVTNLTGRDGTGAVATGNIGEVLSVNVTSVAISTAVANLTSLSITAGVWMVIGFGSNNGAAASNTFFRLGVSANSASFTGCTDGLDTGYPAINADNGVGTVIRFVTQSSTTTWYLACQSSNGSSTYAGSIRAVRIG